MWKACFAYDFIAMIDYSVSCKAALPLLNRSSNSIRRTLHVSNNICQINLAGCSGRYPTGMLRLRKPHGKMKPGQGTRFFKDSSVVWLYKTSAMACHTETIWPMLDACATRRWQNSCPITEISPRIHQNLQTSTVNNKSIILLLNLIFLYTTKNIMIIHDIVKVVFWIS